jgi:hypothetical protein
MLNMSVGSYAPQDAPLCEVVSVPWGTSEAVVTLVLCEPPWKKKAGRTKKRKQRAGARGGGDTDEGEGARGSDGDDGDDGDDDGALPWFGVSVATLTGKTIPLRVRGSTTAAEVKGMIQATVSLCVLFT